MTKRLFIFASWDRDNIIDDYAVYYIKRLSETGDVIFVADNELSESEIDKISPRVIHHITGVHGEYDFGSYKRGFRYAEEQGMLDDYQWIILCNDSVYGPFYPLEPLLMEMEGREVPVWGFSVNTVCGYPAHIQSYFIAMSGSVFNNEKVRAFIRSVKKEENKRNIVLKYEAGFSSLLNSLGFGLHGYYKDDLNFNNDPQGRNFLKMTERGFPFFKIQLLGSNINYVPLFLKYKKIRDIVPLYPFHMMQNNIKRRMGFPGRIYFWFIKPCFAPVLNIYRLIKRMVPDRVKGRIKKIFRIETPAHAG